METKVKCAAAYGCNEKAVRYYTLCRKHLQALFDKRNHIARYRAI